MEPTEIRALTVLPARRQDIELHTADGLTLVGELALPLDRDPVATLITLHPLPTHGGFMDSHVFRKAAWRLPALADLAVLRFNLRGVSSPRGTSEGEFGGGDDERFDVAAAIEYAEFHDLPRRWLVGWSFGADLALKHGPDYPIRGAILLSPTLGRTTPAELERWARGDRRLIAIVPEHDQFLDPAAAARAFAGLPHTELIAVEGGKHLWVGEKQVSRVMNEIVKAVNPVFYPLPTVWNGPVVSETSDAATTRSDEAPTPGG
jgi:alpha/beta superfamily hydrolase